MGVRRVLVMGLVRWCPATRCYPLKARILSCAGWRVHETARVVSSVQLVGSFDLIVGAGTFIGHDVLVTGGQATIHIGSCVDIAPRVVVLCGTHEIDMSGDRCAGRGYCKDVKIGDGAWIGAGSIILPGVTIGAHSVIGAGSMVCRNIPPYVIAVGNPCRPIKSWDSSTGRFVPAA